MRNAVRFRSARFNTTEIKDYFINEICFGDDLANFLNENLKKRGLKIIEPWQEDWGWQFEADHCLISVAFDGDIWQIYVEPILSVFQKLTGKATDISGVTKNLHQILENAPQIYEIQWFQSNKSGEEIDFASKP